MLYQVALPFETWNQILSVTIEMKAYEQFFFYAAVIFLAFLLTKGVFLFISFEPFSRWNTKTCRHTFRCVLSRFLKYINNSLS